MIHFVYKNKKKDNTFLSYQKKIIHFCCTHYLMAIHPINGYIQLSMKLNINYKNKFSLF